MTEPSVFVNDNPISETEVYHDRKAHASNTLGWRNRHVRETTPSEAVEDGLRPCKVCEPPTPSGYVENEYWLVYLYDPDDPSTWIQVGLVENRAEVREWWGKIVDGEIELPDRYDGWWVSDRPVSPGLWEGEP